MKIVFFIASTLIITSQMTYAIALTDQQKINNAIAETSHSLNQDIGVVRKHILDNSLMALSQNYEIDHETNLVLENLEKKFPAKSQTQILALVTSVLLSETK